MLSFAAVARSCILRVFLYLRSISRAIVHFSLSFTASASVTQFVTFSQMCDTAYPLKRTVLPFFALVPALRCWGPARGNWPEARARNRRHRAIMPRIQIVDDSTGERNSMDRAGIDERSSGWDISLYVSPRDGREGARVHRAWTSASLVTRQLDRLKIFNFRLAEDSPATRDPLLRTHRDATSDPCTGGVLCRRSRLTMAVV